jgi:molybdenum cofactor biosynthesis protein B
MGSIEHERLAGDTPVTCVVVTVSDTRTDETDISGQLIASRIRDAGHGAVDKRIIRDEPDQIAALLDEFSAKADVVIFNGGTGISRRDSTYEAISAMLEKTLPGFGEIFRMLSFEEVGPAAMLSRAVAGVYRDTIVFSIPGSTNAVRLAMDRLILPQLRHLVWEILRQGRAATEPKQDHVAK